MLHLVTPICAASMEYQMGFASKRNLKRIAFPSVQKAPKAQQAAEHGETFSTTTIKTTGSASAIAAAAAAAETAAERSRKNPSNEKSVEGLFVAFQFPSKLQAVQSPRLVIRTKERGCFYYFSPPPPPSLSLSLLKVK